MKTTLRYATVIAFAIGALIWPAAKVTSTQGEEESIKENAAAREAFRRLQSQDENGQIPPNALLTAYEQKQAMEGVPEAWSEFQTEGGPEVPLWTPIGPGNIGGRIRSIIIHPTSPSIMWLGAVAGGVWKTTNGGASWSTNTDSLANLAVNCMAIDPANPNVLYAGTGEGYFNFDAVQGYGIFKTSDGGNTWLQLPSTVPSPSNPDFYFVNRIAIAPTNPQLILVATRFPGKILRSTDGGATWSQRLQSSIMEDVVFRPTGTAATTCLAATFSGLVYYSTDDGLNWTLSSDLPAPVDYQRAEVAYSRSNPSIVYASVAANGGQLYRSINGGMSFVLRQPAPPPPVGETEPGTRVNWYNNSLWVDPTNSDTVIVGGGSMWRSTQGGAGGWTQATNIHPDHHVFVEHPGYNGVTNNVVYGGNDGGIYRIDNVLASNFSWTSLNHSLAITQFYGGAGNVATGKIVGGTQDNGTVRYRPQDGPENWTTMFYGDGGFCAADQTDANYFYGEHIYLQIYRSRQGADPDTTNFIHKGIADTNNCPTSGCYANFIAPFVLDPNNPDTMLAGGRSLWRSINVKADNPTWTAIKSSINPDCIADCGRYNISAIAVAPGNSNIVWVGYNDGSVFHTANGTASTPTWTQSNSGLPARMCTRITLGPPEPTAPLGALTPYVTFGSFSNNNLWKTTSNGATWTSIHNNLPSVPVFSLVVSPSKPSFLYVGTEIGIFASADGGSTWSKGALGAGQPANTRVDELFWMGNRLVAATHGRSMFSLGQ